MIIVIAWMTMDGLELTGKQVRYDGYNTRAEFRPAPLAKANVWLNDGTDADLQKAEAYLAREAPGASIVLTFPSTEEEPLKRARSEIVDLFKAGKLKAVP